MLPLIGFREICGYPRLLCSGKNIFECINLIYRFSSTSRATKAIFKFQKLRRLSESGQNIFIVVHHFDESEARLGLNG